MTDELLEADGIAERKKIIDDNQDLWRSIKGVLAAVGYQKCWYCETADIRSDNAVDHFRPKGRISGEGTEGYWWLAFDVRNYRFACTYCNSRRHGEGGTIGGKADFFPLAAGSRRSDSHLIPISVEIPMLLDPCDQFDITALWFDETGQVKVNPGAEILEENVSDRVAVSRSLYHLDHVRLIEARKRVFLEVLQMCDQADEALVSYKSTQDVMARSIFHESINALRRMKKEDAPYSAVAKCAVRGYRSTSPSAKLIAEAS
ncbi:hypothetical protein [Streptomyces sp. CFMR 7]|uniref:hypothetical protein n=1 Tax=Streptomyces sp. CFMR 7 TaxID=1649184 RepID=UPI0011A01C4D|nr:hypothetical protein [Streptomyces sp. CFMR 7]